MDKAKFIKELKKVLTDFYFDDEINMGKNIHGDKKVPQIEYRDETKDTVREEGVRRIFIATEMGTPEKQFLYSTIFSRGQKRHYRCKHFFDAEIKKVFLSGATYELLLEQFKEHVDAVNGL